MGRCGPAAPYAVAGRVAATALPTNAASVSGSHQPNSREWHLCHRRTGPRPV